MAELKKVNTYNNDINTYNNDIKLTEVDLNGKVHQAHDNKGFQDEADAPNGLPVLVNDYDGSQTNPDEDPGCFSRAVNRIQTAVSRFFETNRHVIKAVVLLVLLAAYFSYFAYAMYYRFGDEGSWRLLIVTILCALGIVFKTFLKYRRSDDNGNDSRWKLSKLRKFLGKLRLPIVIPIVAIVAILIYVIVDVALDRPRNMISAGGIVFFLGFCFVFSNNPAKVKWRPVLWGLALQLLFALLILRTSWGHDAFQWLADRITEFLAYTDAGSIFVFGEVYDQHYFAFKVLPVVVYFSTFVAMLYYLGVMQVAIKVIGQFLALCLGTSPSESINAAGNIFLGMTEAPLMVRPFLKDMTKSEIHAVMTGGFATIAGGVMAAYILYKVPANHLLSASVMSAPAALAMAKLFYPETVNKKHNAKDFYNIPKGTEKNLIEAASNGASMSVKVVANIAVNLIAFVALLHFVNASLTWFGDRVGVENLTFQLVCSYLFWPLSFLMGVDQDDCRTIGELIGTKILLNEFVAYVDLSKYINNQITFDEYWSNFTSNSTANLTGVWTYIDDDIYLNDTQVTLTHGLISRRSVVIATYALCGFSNLSSMGMQLGALGAMAPERKGDLSKIVFRAMLAGNVACFLTACIAGLFYTS
ncbi:solute carrier family 28 member 3-like [Physella acuta]|uniref:solute carrier family 28 member 3-like n=1 Tax=Physella acuta TaxID=109671 RepID=UPI0027DCC6E9|nr:solute carrier family 28 member 3-like [Physella acuta]